MTPFEILRRTPKNNCGQCGYPTCLAFAAAVATSNQAPDKCPFIDLTGMAMPQPAADEGRTPAEEKDLALIKHLKSKIASLDFTAIAAPLGIAATDANTLRFSFLLTFHRFLAISMMVTAPEAGSTAPWLMSWPS